MTDGKTIQINVRAVVDELLGPLKTGENAIKSFGASTEAVVAQVEQSTEKISRLWRAAFEAFIGIEAVKVLKDIALGAAEAAEELDVASRVAKNFGNTLNAAAMEQWLTQFAKSASGGGYAIDQMRASVDQFAAVGLNAQQIQKALADTADLAAAHNMNFAEATNVVRMALTGHVEMLTRYGIISREAAKNIKTVDDAMKALEKSTSGAAAERANSLIGIFGRLSTAAALLGDKIGTGLEPFFNTVVTLMTNLANALGNIPAPVMQFIGTLAALGVSLIAVTLILPAIAKGITIVGEGFRLLSGLGAPLITMVGRLTATLGFATDGFAAFSAAEIASVAPIAAIIVAIAGIVVAVVELTNHLDHVKTAWHDWTQYLSDSFHEFSENFKKDQTVVLQLIEDIAGAIANPTAAGTYLSKIPQLAPNAAIKAAPKLDRDDSQIGADIVGDWKKIAGQIVDFFKSSISSLSVPSAHFPGVIPGTKGKDGSAAAAENALRNFDEATKNWLAGFQARVDKAKSILDISQERLADFDVKHPADQGLSEADQAARQKLVTNELAAQSSLRDKILAQQKAETQAAAEYEQVAKAISPALKNHDALVRQALDAAREHSKAARDLYLNYLQAGTALDSIIAKERQAAIDRVDTAVQAANQAGEQTLTGKNLQRDVRGEAITGAADLDKAKGKKPTGEAEDRVAIALAQLAVAAAVDTEALKQNELARAREAYDKTKSLDDLNRLNEAQNALMQATLDVAKAEDARAVDEQKLITDQQSRWTQLIDDLVSKAGAPGLSSQGGAVSFNPLQFLVAAFEQSQTFADVMSTVNAIMRVFVQIFNAFRPVIDILLDAVRTVANIFIFLYNSIARILDALGMHLQLLNYLNSAYEDGLVPLVSIIHEIPTLNELAAGSLNNPLSTQPVGINNMAGMEQTGQRSIGLLSEIMGILLATFGVVVLEKVFSGLSLQQAIQQTLHMLGINLGQKVQTSLQTVTNSILTSGFATLEATMQELVIATQAGQAASGFGGILGTLLGLGGAAATGGATLGFAGIASMGAMAQQAAGPLQVLGAAAQQVQDAFSSAARTVRDSGTALGRFMDTVSKTTQMIDRSISVTAPVSVASPNINGNMDVEDLGTTLAESILRRVQTGMYGINRAPA